jgi:hypothetical protein
VLLIKKDTSTFDANVDWVRFYRACSVELASLDNVAVEVVFVDNLFACEGAPVDPPFC